MSAPRRAGSRWFVEVLVGSLLGGVVVLEGVLWVRSRTEHELLSAWQERRLAALSTSQAVLVGLVVLQALVVISSAALVRRRTGPAGAGRLVTGLAVGACLALLLTGMSAETSPGPPGLLAPFLFMAVLSLARRWSAVALRAPFVVAAVVTALAAGGAGIARPLDAHPLPSDEALAWWAAHDNGAIGLIDPLTAVGRELRAPVRDVEAVRASCRRFRTVSQALGAPPLAPVELRGAVAEVSGGLVRVADRCITEAGAISSEDLLASYQQVSSTDAARQVDRLGT